MEYSPFRRILGDLGHQAGCHQIPERSFFRHGIQYPLCARCTGVLIGQATAILLSVIELIPGLLVSGMFLLIMGIDWGLQRFNILESTNSRRLLTGMLGGAGYTFLLISLLTAIGVL